MTIERKVLESLAENMLPIEKMFVKTSGYLPDRVDRALVLLGGTLEDYKALVEIVKRMK